MDHAKFRSPYSKRLSSILSAVKPLVDDHEDFVRVERMGRALHAAVRNNATETTKLLLAELDSELDVLTDQSPSADAPLAERLVAAAATDARAAWKMLNGMVTRNYPGET